MILSDQDIKARLSSGSVVIEPLEDRELQIQPASVDLRLSSQFRRATNQELETVPDGEDFILAPGEFALGATIERLRVPVDLVARVEGRSSVGRLGILVHATAGFIDPGFDGNITLELANLGPTPARLRPGSRICQIVFHEMTSAASRPYGPQRGSKYMGQQGPTLSRLSQD